jgi:hypothetical protein
MKNVIIAFFFFLELPMDCFSQTFTGFFHESDVFNYLNGKKFSRTVSSVSIGIGYSGTINSYGIKLNESTTHFNLPVIIISPKLAMVTGESLQKFRWQINIRVNTSTNCLIFKGA